MTTKFDRKMQQLQGIKKVMESALIDMEQMSANMLSIGMLFDVRYKGEAFVTMYLTEHTWENGRRIVSLRRDDNNSWLSDAPVYVRCDLLEAYEEGTLEIYKGTPTKEYRRG